MKDQSVEITFDCLPLRSVGRLDIPLDASSPFRSRCERIKAAMEKHGTHNSYYLYNAHCIYQLTNDPTCGMLNFGFEGTLLTNAEDLCSLACDLDCCLEQDTCDWLSEPVVSWFCETVSTAVLIEFNSYISAGDLTRSKERAEQIAASCDEAGGFLGMYL